MELIEIADDPPAKVTKNSIRNNHKNVTIAKNTFCQKCKIQPMKFCNFQSCFSGRFCIFFKMELIEIADDPPAKVTKTALEIITKMSQLLKNIFCQKCKFQPMKFCNFQSCFSVHFCIFFKMDLIEIADDPLAKVTKNSIRKYDS